jgi:autotransporter-associated beta strand protein
MKTDYPDPTLNSAQRRLSCVVCLFLVQCLTGPVLADTHIWDGSSSGAWGTGANWQSGVVPVDGDDLVFPSGAARLANTNNLVSRRFRSVTVGASGYVLRGYSLTLSNGLSAQFTSGASTNEIPISLAAPQIIECANSGGYFYCDGDIDLATNDLTIQGAGHLYLRGAISGSGGLIKNGSGTHWLEGSSANTYTGDTRVNNGTLMLAKTGGNAVTYGELFVGDGLGGADADLVREQGNFQIGSIPVTVASSGWLDADDYSDTIGSLTIAAGGHAGSVAGTLTLGGNVKGTGAGTATIDGNLSLGSATRIFDIPSAMVLLVDASVSGSGGITKTNSGFLGLRGANTYTGVTTVQQGNVDIYNSHSLGATNGGTVLQDGKLRLVGVVVDAETLQVDDGWLQALYATNAWTGGITLNSDLTIDVPNAGQMLNLACPISGTGGFTTIGPGTVMLSGSSPNTFAGNTYVNNGLLLLDKTGTDNALPGPGDLFIGDDLGDPYTDIVRELSSFQIGSDVDITVNSSGFLDLNDNSDSVGALNLVGGHVDTGTGTMTLGGMVSATSVATHSCTIYGKISLGSFVRTFDIANGPVGPDLHIFAQVSGPGGIIKNGTGQMTLESTNTYNGSTTVAAGRLDIRFEGTLGTTNAGTVVQDGATLSLSGAQIGNEALTIQGTGLYGFGALLAWWFEAASNSWSGPITLAADTLVYVGETNVLNLAGPISGPGGLTKVGPDVLIMSAPMANTYEGNTTINEGRLDLSSVAGNAIPGGTLTIGDGVGNLGADEVRYLRSSQIRVGANILIRNSGRLNLNDHSDDLGAITFQGGLLRTGTGVASLRNDVTVMATNRSAFIDGIVYLVGSRTFDIANSLPVINDLSVNAEIRGTALVKSGSGTMYLAHSNSFSGLATVQEGVVRLYDDFALGETGGGTIVSNGAALVLDEGVHVGAEALTIRGVGPSSLGALQSLDGSNSWAGQVTLSADTTISVSGDHDLNLSGAVLGTGDLTKIGAGTLYFSGPDANAFNGSTRVQTGVLVLNKSGANRAIPGRLEIGSGLGLAEAEVVRLAASTQIANTSDVVVNSSGLLNLDGFGEAIDGLSGSGRVDLGSGFLNIGAGNGSSTFTGVIRGSGTLSKLGSGTIVFTGANTYSGATTVEVGTLAVNGTQPSSAMQIHTGATLAGIGTVGAITSTAGTVSPGPPAPTGSAGLLSSGGLVLDAPSTFKVDLNGLAPGLYDQMNIVGSVLLSTPALQITSSELSPALGDQFILVNNDGEDAVGGSFDGLPNGSTVVIGARQFRINYNGGSGNDIVLTAINIPVAYAALMVEAGNGDGEIGPNECNDIRLALRNIDTNTMSSIRATMTTTTPGARVTQAVASYPDLPPGQMRYNLLPFQLSTSPDFVCGTPIDLVLFVTTETHGNCSVRHKTATGSPALPLRFNNNTPMAVIDSGSITSSVTVAGITAPVAKVQVSLFITHANDADLDLSLIAPDGTLVLLSTDNGGTGDSYGTSCEDAQRTLFDSESPNPVTAGVAPFVGTFRPEGSLATFIGATGSTVNGPWRLVVADDTAGNTGALNCWSLFVSPAACSPGSGTCELCASAVVSGCIAESDPASWYLAQDHEASTCDTPKSPPPSGAAALKYQAIELWSGWSNACVTVEVSSTCNASNQLMSMAYLGGFDPVHLDRNYVADPGWSACAGTSRIYSFNVPANTNFTIVVQQTDPDQTCADYLLKISGADCRPLLAITKAPANSYVLSWTTAAPGYQLEAVDVLSPDPAFVGVWPLPVVVDSQYALTNSSAGTSRYYRLNKPGP